MNTLSRGIRNAFRNHIRTFCVVIILGLAIGLSLVMAVAHQAVIQKTNDVKSSVGNTIAVQPAGFSNFSQANNTLTTSQFNKVASLSHVRSVAETLTDRLTTIGTAQPSFGRDQNASTTSNNQTSLTSPVTINFNGRNGGGRAFVNGGGSLPTNFSLPITIIGTNNPASVSGTDISLSGGQNINGSSDVNEALISQAMASKNNLTVGSTFTAYSTNITVAGIFNSGTSQNNGGGLENTVVVPLPALQSLTGQSGAVTSAVITVDSADDLTATTSAVQNVLGSSADIQNAQDQANNTLEPLKSVSNISVVSLVGATIAGAVIIFLVMLMIVRERRREIGILKAIGSSNAKVIKQFMFEAITLTVMALVVGVIVGAAAASPVTNTLVNNAVTSTTSSAPAQTATNQPAGGNRFQRFGGGQGANENQGSGNFTRGRGLGTVRANITNLNASVGLGTITYGILSAVIIAVVGSGLSAYMIAKVRPAEVMRSE